VLESPPDATIAVVPANVKQTLIDEMGVLIGYVVDVESFPTESDVDERISRTFNLMHQCRVMGEQEVYLRLVHTLVDLHLKLRNFGEAALALALHIQVLPWSDQQQLPTFMGLPAQSAAERRALLMRRSIDLFGAAGMWERAIDVARLLAQYYQSRYKYAELADVLALQSQFLRNILEPSRVFNSYWYLSFSGANMPVHLRDKEFITSRPPHQTWSELADRLRLEFPDARLFNTILSKQDAAQLPACICGILVEPFPEDPSSPTPSGSGSDLALLGADGLGELASSAAVPGFVRVARLHDNVKRFRAVFRVAEGDAEYVFNAKDAFPSVLTRLAVVQKNINLLPAGSVVAAPYSATANAHGQPRPERTVSPQPQQGGAIPMSQPIPMPHHHQK
jgi:hypothetical protein